MQGPEKVEEQPPPAADAAASDEMLAAQLAQQEAEGEGDKPAEDTTSQSISSHVTQELATQLIDMGFSKNVSEKSLFLTQNASLEKALEWIEQHNEDADFEEELRIVGSDATATSKPKLSAEERKQKAKELQEVIRKKRKAQEEALEKQREIDRIKGGKRAKLTTQPRK